MDLTKFDSKQLRAFYIDQLKNNILPFWMDGCLDREYGGFLNCYDNRKKELLSCKKFAWSQGRFVWMFSALAQLGDDVFSREERDTFLSYAKNGADFLKQHVFIGDTLRCSFLMERSGDHILQDGFDVCDTSIYADCFVAAGFLRYAAAAGDEAYFDLGCALCQDIERRVAENKYYTLPYPSPANADMHGIPMILLNVATEAALSCEAFSRDSSAARKRVRDHAGRILTRFVDDREVLREMHFNAPGFRQTLLGRYTNPGHTIEDFWFLVHAFDLLGEEVPGTVYSVLRNALNNGWDKEYGGIRLFADCFGGEPAGPLTGIEEEPMTRQVLDNNSDKVWWVHSEALYSLVLAYTRTGDQDFWDWYVKVHRYVFRTFPNPNKDEGEWIQIRDREGRPSAKLVALPVKDPYHISRNFILLLKLLR